MARSRNIKPSIMDNEDLADLSPLHRLLFIYLWMLADREGRLEDRPKRIAVKALPYDRDADVDRMLSDLQAGGFLRRYVVDSVACIQITSFVKHQKPHQNETKSELPAPPVEPASSEVPTQAQALPPKDEALPTKDASTSLLNSDCLIPSSLKDDCLEERERGASAAAPPPGFDAFWRAYPNTGRKVDKAKCLKTWRKDRLEPRTAEVVDHVLAMRQTQQWQSGYEPAPLTYLNGRRYEDPVPRAGPRNEARAYFEATLSGDDDGTGNTQIAGGNAVALR